MLGFDIRPMYRFMSMTIHSMGLFVPMMTLSLSLFVGLATNNFVIGALLGVVGAAAVGIPFHLGMLAMLRASRNGDGPVLLDALAQPFGGTVSRATLLLPLLPPRLTGELRGRPVVVDLMRMGGVFGPRRVGPRWILTARVASRPGPVVGVVPKGTGFMALLGMNACTPRGQVDVYTPKRHPDGLAFADVPGLDAMARRVFDVVGPSMVKFDGKNANIVAAHLPRILEPGEVRGFLEALCDLAEAYDGTSPSSEPA